MADMRRFALLDLLLLLLILGVAGGVRAGYLMTCADGSRNGGPLRVQESSPSMPGFISREDMRGHPKPRELDALIDSVQKTGDLRSQAPLAGKEEATAHVAPAYPWLVGQLARLTSADKVDSMVRWIQMGLGALTAAFYYLFARRAFRSLTVGVLAGLFAALHPFWVIAVATVDDGVLSSFAVATVLLLASQAGEKGGPLQSLALGLALAGMTLVRAAFLPFAFITLVWFLIRSQTLPRSWLCGLLAFLGFINGLAPWTVRNVQTFREPVPIVTSAWLHLWIGNSPEATGGPVTDEIWQTAPLDELKDAPTQAVRYARLGKAVIAEVREDPATALKRRVYAGLTFLLGAAWFEDGSLAEVAPSTDAEMPDWLSQAYPATLQGVLLAMLLLAGLGWRWSYGWRYESIPAALAMVWVPIPYILGHGEWLSGPRLPLDGVMLCYAAFALACVLPGVGGTLLEGAVETETV